MKILESIPKEKISTYVSSAEIAHSLIDQYNIVTAIIFDLSEYTDRVNTEWEKGTIHKDNVESIELFNLPFSHRSNIASRLGFIR